MPFSHIFFTASASSGIASLSSNEIAPVGHTGRQSPNHRNNRHAAVLLSHHANCSSRQHPQIPQPLHFPYLFLLFSNHIIPPFNIMRFRLHYSIIHI